MAWLKVSATGLGYLSLVTSLLQRIVVTDPLAVVWEAADLQWWWRVDQHPEPSRQTFWLDGARVPVAAAVFTDWRGELAIDVMWASEQHDQARSEVWPSVVEKIATVDGAIDTTLIDGSPLIAAFQHIGFVPTNEISVTTTMRALSRPAVSPLPLGFELCDRTTVAAPHHMIGRSSPDVAERLAAAGCETLMVTYLANNPVSQHLYLSTGFQPQKTSRGYRREK
jgi:hypothetical protein